MIHFDISKQFCIERQLFIGIILGSSGNRELQVWMVNESSPGFDAYLARVQTLALWYIEAAQYTDNDDPRWQHYFLLVL